MTRDRWYWPLTDRADGYVWLGWIWLIPAIAALDVITIGALGILVLGW